MLQLRGNTLAYIKGRSVIVHDLGNEKHQVAPRQIQREALLTTIAVSNNERLIAAGDEYGKIYIIHNGQEQG